MIGERLVSKLKYFFLTAALIFSTTACTQENEDKEVTKEVEELEISQENKSFNSKEKIKIGSSSVSSIISLYETKDLYLDPNDLDISYFDEDENLIDKISNQEVDMAFVPADEAAQLYNDNADIKLLAINSLGNLYAVSKNEIKSISNLKNKNIYVHGIGSSLSRLVDSTVGSFGKFLGIKVNHFDQMNTFTKNLLNDSTAIAILSEPYVSKVLNMDHNLKVIMDVNQLFKDQFDDQEIISEVLIVNDDFLEENKESVDKFLYTYKKSLKRIYQDLDDKSDQVAEKTGLEKDMVTNSVYNLRLVFIEGKEMKEEYQSYMEILSDIDKSLIGNKIPDDNFYYIND